MEKRILKVLEAGKQIMTDYGLAERFITLEPIEGSAEDKGDISRGLLSTLERRDKHGELKRDLILSLNAEWMNSFPMEFTFIGGVRKEWGFVLLLRVSWFSEYPV